MNYYEPYSMRTKFTKEDIFADEDYRTLRQTERYKARAIESNIVLDRVWSSKQKKYVERGDTKAFKWECPMCDAINWRNIYKFNYVAWLDRCSHCSNHVLISI